MTTPTSVLPPNRTQAQRRRAVATDPPDDTALRSLRVSSEKKGWHFPLEPVRHEALMADPNIAYCRKSSDDPRKQTASIPAQRKELAAFAGRSFVFEVWETFSGTTFEDRPAFMRLLALCTANPQPHDKEGRPTGTIWCVDQSRFSRQQRIVHGKPLPDIERITAMLSQFHAVGWSWHFRQTGRTGGGLVEMMQSLMHGYLAAQSSSELSAKVSERKRHHALEQSDGGFWMGGVPPYPTVRVDWETRKPLADGEYVQESHRVVLGRGPDEYQATWDFAARQIVDGRTPGQVADMLRARNAPLGPTMLEWNDRAVRRLFENTALIGWPVFGAHRKDEAQRGGEQYKAKWGPLVDEDLFRKARAALEGRRRSGNRAVYDGPVPLRLTCPRCGVVYHHAHTGDGRRIYRHPSSKGTKLYEWKLLARTKGCTNHILDAEDSERAVFDLVRVERLSPDWKAVMRREHERQRRRVDAVESREAEAKGALDRARRQRERLSRQMEALEDPAHVREWGRKLVAQDAEVERLKREWQHARDETVDADAEWERIEDRIREADQLAVAFCSGDLEKRERLFAHWIEQIDVHLTDLPVPEGGRRPKRYRGKAKAKRLVVFLATAPELCRAATLPVRYGAQLCARDGESRSRAG